MVISRRRAMQAAALAATGQFAAAHAQQQYPAKPIKCIIPASPGTTLDALARFMADPVSRRLNTPVVIENRPGAGLLLGTEVVARAPADGYTLLYTGSAHYAARGLSDTPLTFDPLSDFVPVARMSRVALGIVVRTDAPYKTLADLIAAMKARPGELTYSSSGIGSTAHLCAVALNDATQTTARHVAYRGNGPAVIDVASGQVEFTCQGPGVILPLLQSGKLRGLAVTGRTRWDAFPDVPTAIEAGVPDFDMSSWSGVLAPARTPPAALQLLSDAFIRAGQTPEFKAFCAQQSASVELVGHREFAGQVREEEAYWMRIAQLSKKS
ncbi:tripartite tricarboxylate transporter substrate binding protein [Pseudorhodoferax sp.]|uniref:tripartite tricarboxylate transporter substrate binding protein n=1 Tax=Pseudorhodoferax sp. TaxID=1993553 RepID=UPI0039E56E1F